MTTRVRREIVSLRPYPDERLRWKAAAAVSGLTEHGWAKQVLNEEAAAVAARQADDARAVDERERLRRLAFPQEEAR